MTGSIIVMIVLGLIIIIASFFLSEKLTKKEDNFNIDLLTVDDSYEFSDRELRIIKRKIEDVIANQAKDILYETNESLANMANEKTMALGDYAVAVCDEIEKNHKEVMFLYSMLDDKQKEIMNTVRTVDETNKNVKELLSKVQQHVSVSVEQIKTSEVDTQKQPETKLSAIDHLTELSKQKKESDILSQSKAETLKDKPQMEQKRNNALVIETNEEQSDNEDVIEENSIEDNSSIDDVFAELDKTELDFDEVLEEEFEDNENSNDIILEMYRNGSSIIDIAKQLGLGVGEVKLVIDLYQGE